MVRRLTSLLLIFAAVAVAAAAGEAKCTAKAKKCEEHIREMLRGRRWLGVQFEKTRFGIMIRGVIPESPAEAAGFQPDDQIIAINGEDLSRAEITEVKRALQEARQNRDGYLNVVVTRYGQVRRVLARLGELPQEHIDSIVEAHLREGHGIERKGQ